METILALVTELKRGDTIIRYASTSRTTAMNAAFLLLMSGEKNKWAVSVYPKEISIKEFTEWRNSFGEGTVQKILGADAEGFLDELTQEG